jgi:uncharacterized membrane protein
MLRQYVHHRHSGVAPGFRPRGSEVSRIEGFSDCVFAFALTLLVVSLEVPNDVGQLVHAMRGFFAFAICFALFLQIWSKHYTFFRRYGLQDTPTRVWNGVLLFIVLFYVYPLKFLWTHMVHIGGGESFSAADARILIVVYGLGGAAVFLVFVFMHRHAWRLRDEMELNEIERYDTRASIVENWLMAAVPLFSVALALVLPDSFAVLAGLSYVLYAPILTWNGMRESRGRRPLEENAKRVEESAAGQARAG